MVDPPAAASMVRYLRVAANSTKKNPNYLLNEQYDQHEAMAALIVVRHWSWPVFSADIWLRIACKFACQQPILTQIY